MAKEPNKEIFWKSSSRPPPRDRWMAPPGKLGCLAIARHEVLLMLLQVFVAGIRFFAKPLGFTRFQKKNMDYSPTLLNAMLTIKGRNIFWFFILKMKEDSIFFNMFGKIVVNHPTRACLLLTPHLLKMCFSQRKKVQWKYWLPEKRRSVPCPYISWIYNKGTLDFLCAQMKRQAIGILKPLQNDAFFLRTVKLILCLLSSSLLLS